MGSYSFVIVADGDKPVYEAEFIPAHKKEAQDSANLNQFIIHAALDVVDEMLWSSNPIYLKVVDKFNDQLISAYVTPGRARFMLLHDVRNEDGIRSFMHDVHELYVKVLLNPFHRPTQRIVSETFDARVRALGKKYLN